MKIGILVFVLFMVLGFGALYMTKDVENKNETEIKQLYDNIAIYDEKYMEEDLFASYSKLLTLFPDDYELMEEYISACEKYGHISEAINAYEKAYSMNTAESKYAEKMAENYIDHGEYSNAMKYIKNCMNTVSDTSKLEEMYNQIKYTYKTYRQTYDNIFDWQDGYAKVEKAGKFGFVDAAGNLVVNTEYDDVGTISTELGYFSAKHRDKYVYLNVAGYRKIVPDSTYSYLGTAVGGLANCEKDGVWGFFGTSGAEGRFEFEYTGQITDDVCAVKKDGKWELLVASSLENATGRDFDEIKLDDYGNCSFNGVVFVKNFDAWTMINTSGERIGSLEFEDVRVFASNEAAAVKKSGKWGFVNTDGTWLIEPKYDDAKSFSAGYAPIKKDGVWNYIDTSGNVCIVGDFFDAKPFSSAGLAAVKYDGAWTFIRLNEYI